MAAIQLRVVKGAESSGGSYDVPMIKKKGRIKCGIPEEWSLRFSKQKSQGAEFSR